MRAAEKTDGHDRLVMRVARHLKQRYYRDIRAGAQGFPVPEPVSSGPTLVTPDVTMVTKLNQMNLFAVETAGTVGGERARTEWTALAEHADRCGGRFWVVVPRGAREAAERKLQELGLTATVWEFGPARGD